MFLTYKIIFCSITTGKLVGVLKEIASTDITVLYIGDQRGHTYYIGTNSGDIMSINFRAGTVTSVVPNISGEISCIRLLNHALNESFYIISSLDGSIMQVRETEGSLWPPFKRNNDLFGPSAGISTFCIVEAFTVVIAISNKVNGSSIVIVASFLFDINVDFLCLP